MRNPPNAHAADCLAGPSGAATSHEAFQTTLIEEAGASAVRARFTLTNRCVTRLSVSGLEPATRPGGRIVENAAIEVAIIAEMVIDTETSYYLAGTGLLGVFDIPANATVTRDIVIRATNGAPFDVVAASAQSYLYNGGSAYVPGLERQVGGIGVRNVCVHYADRPCGAYQ